MSSPSRQAWFWAVQALTTARVVLAFLFVSLSPFATLRFLVAALYAMAWITDFFDGRLARSRQVTSQFGGAMDVFGDRYLTVLSLMYVGFRGVSLAVLGVILLREVYSVAMRMVQIEGRGIMMSNPKVGGVVHIVIGVGTLNFICQPQAHASLLFQVPFLLVAIFYALYFPWTITMSWQSIITSIKADLKKSCIPESED